MPFGFGAGLAQLPVLSLQCRVQDCVVASVPTFGKYAVCDGFAAALRRPVSGQHESRGNRRFRRESFNRAVKTPILIRPVNEHVCLRSPVQYYNARRLTDSYPSPELIQAVIDDGLVQVYGTVQSQLIGHPVKHPREGLDVCDVHLSSSMKGLTAS